MKTSRILIITLCFLAMCFLSVFAHPGRTDSNGGHWNHSTGEYHYHSGEYAGRDSSDGFSSIFSYIVICIVIGIVFWTWYAWSELIQPYLPNVIISSFESAIFDYKNAVSHENFCENKLNEIKEKAVPPKGYKIGYDGLPKEIDSLEWGESLTVFTAYNGWKLHSNMYCDKHLSKHHAWYFYNKRHTVCKICAANYEIPNMEWYIEHKRIADAEKRLVHAKEKSAITLNKLHNSYKDCKTKRVDFFMFFAPKKRRILNKLFSQYITLIKNK